MEPTVKEVKHLKCVFYKNISAEGGAMLQAINKANDTDVILHSQTTKLGRMWGYTNTTNFLKLLEKNNGLYEVITKFPHKVYFDIDEDEKQENVSEYIEKVKHIILTYFPNAEMAISGSNTETKSSLHIILNNYTIHNEAERIYMRQLVKYISLNLLDSFDWKVYTKNRNMKCINQGKLDGRLQEIIENTDYKAHCITNFLNDYCLPFPGLNYEIEEAILIEKSNSTFDLGELPKMVLSVPEHIDYNEMTPQQALQMLPLDTKKFAHTYTHLVARFCFYNKIGFEEFLSWLQNKHKNLNLVKDKWAIHWANIHKFPSVPIDRIKTILCSFYPHLKKDKYYRDFVETFNLPEPNISLIETIDQTCYSNDKKYNVFNIGMGGGKTAQTIDYLKYESNFLWIAPNIALASNTTNRFEEKDIDVTNYQRITTKDKKNGLLNNENKLIICLNSLHYLTTTTYKVLIIDEIETLLDKFLGDFIEQGKAQLKIKIWNKFIELIRSAEKVIFLDAFITSKTTNFIKSIEGSLTDVIIYKRIVEPQTRIIKYCDNFELTLNEIITKIKNGSKIFIFYPYKNQNSNVFSMEQVFNVIKEKTSKCGIFYNADVDDNIKKELKNVNKTWENYDFVITNNILTCGVNYENLDFDYKYLFIASFNTPRDIIQVSYRARHLSSGIINVCYLGKMNSTTTWLNDCDKFKCSIYNDLYKSILIEKKAPIKRAFQLFCVKAHYKQEVSQKKIDDALEEEIKSLLKNQQVGYFYDSIDDIDVSQAEIISQHCVSQEATMYEKVCLKKFYFNKMFLDDAKDVTFQFSELNFANPIMLSYTWNEKYNFFFVKMRQLLSNKDNIFNKIAELNKLDNLFPTEVKKTKLNDEILDQIFKEFSFKFISRSSSTAKILKEIYNTFFGSFIISTKFDANKHAMYSIADPVVPHLYGFCKKYLILDHETNIVYQNLENDELSSSIEI